MKVFHIDAKSNADVTIPKDKLKLLPKVKFGIVTTIQHLHKIKDVQNQLPGSVFAGQVLGCNALVIDNIEVDAWLFVGSGEFHPVNVALKSSKPVWLWNPASRQLGELPKERVDSWLKRKRAQLSKYLMAKKVGIIVTVKPGQKNLLRALELKKNKDKEFFLFACDELNAGEFENFNFIDFWVNTACPRIPDEMTNIINIDDLIEANILKLPKKSYESPMWKTMMGLKK